MTQEAKQVEQVAEEQSGLTPISVLDLGDRIEGTLAQNNLSSVEALAGYDKKRLTALKGVGGATADEILMAVAKHLGAGTKEEAGAEVKAEVLDQVVTAIIEESETDPTDGPVLEGDGSGVTLPAIEEDETVAVIGNDGRPLTQDGEPVFVAASAIAPKTAEAPVDASQVEQLTQLLRWTMDVLRRQSRTQGSNVAGMLAQSVLRIRPELSPEALHEMEGKLPIKDFRF